MPPKRPGRCRFVSFTTFPMKRNRLHKSPARPNWVCPTSGWTMRKSALLLVLFAGCASPELRNAAVPYDRVTDELVAALSPIEQTVATADGDLSVDCVYQNVSSRPVQINTFVLNASSWILRLSGPDGKVLPTVPLTYYSPEQLRQHVRVLQPGDSYRVHYSGVLHAYMCDMPAARYEVDLIGIRSKPVHFTLLNGRKY